MGIDADGIPVTKAMAEAPYDFLHILFIVACVRGQAYYQGIGLPLMDKIIDDSPIGKPILTLQCVERAGRLRNRLADRDACATFANIKAQQY